MQKIVTNLWYVDDAEAAVDFYCSLFEDAKVLETVIHTEAGPGPEGTVAVVEFQLAGQRFSAINGGERAEYTHAMSLLINCADQDEIDRVWRAILDQGGKEIACGWIADKWGVNWQVWSVEAAEIFSGSDPEGLVRATRAMYGMKKIDIRALRKAYEGG